MKNILEKGGVGGTEKIKNHFFPSKRRGILLTFSIPKHFGQSRINSNLMQMNWKINSASLQYVPWIIYCHPGLGSGIKKEKKMFIEIKSQIIATATGISICISVNNQITKNFFYTVTLFYNFLQMAFISKFSLYDHYSAKIINPRP